MNPMRIATDHQSADFSASTSRHIALAVESKKNQGLSDNDTSLMEAQQDPVPVSGDAARQNGKQLLFVGGKGSWFCEAKDTLSTLRPSWCAHHAGEIAPAMDVLNSTDCDAVIIDEDVPGRTDFLANAGRNFPRILRLLLRGEANRGGTAEKRVYSGAQKESDGWVETIEDVVRALCIHEWTSRPSTRALLARIKKLPVLPRLHTQVINELQSASGSLESVSEFVRQDPVMAAKFLQLVNSAFFGLSYPVANPGEAVMVLGTERTKALILTAGAFSQFDQTRLAGFSAEEVWRHGFRVGNLAYGVALVQTEDAKLAEMAFTAGLLHDIGKLVLASNVPEMYSTACKLGQNKRIPQCESEEAILGATHAELGACLLGTWGLPLGIIEASLWHHCPSRSFDQLFSALTAVHVGNVLAYENTESNNAANLSLAFDLPYLTRLGLAGRRNGWREACGLPKKEHERTFEDTVRKRFEAKHLS